MGIGGGQPPPAESSPEVTRLGAEGKRALRAGMDREDAAELTLAQKAFEQCARLDGRNPVRFYDLARAESCLGTVLESKEGKKAAEHWRDDAIADVQRALVLDDRSSDAHALLADLYGTKIGLGGFWAV